MFIWIALGTALVLMLPFTYAAYRLNIIHYMTGYKWLIPGVLLISGLVMVLMAVKALNLSGVEESWPVSQGRIVSVEISGERAPHPVVTYSYQVADSVYRAVSDMDAPGFGTRAARSQTAEEILKKLTPGAVVKVHYNSSFPQQSVLLARPKWNAFMQYGVGIIFVALALAFVLASVIQLTHK